MAKTSHREELDSRFLTITAVLLVLLGVPAFFSLVQEPNINTSSHQSPEAGRNPASLSADGDGAPALQLSKNATIEITCDRTKPIEDVQANYLRIKTSTCLNKEVDEVTVTNQSNGFTAAVIFTKDTNFTTDFIDLKDGENQIEIEATDKLGVKTARSIIIHKRSPTSVR